jgi:5-methylcytosine-specific restriction endonuclease McrA
LPRREKRPKPLKKTLTGSLQTIVIETELSRARKIDEIVNQGKISYEVMTIPKPGKKPKAKKEKKRKKSVEQSKLSAYQETDLRDEGYCQFPGCYRQGNHHHITFRSAGGKNNIANLVTLCPEHHTNGKNSPHQSEAWRRYWEGWASERYPEYWENIKDGNKIRVGV